MSDVQRYADMKGVDPRTVRRWFKAGKIPAKYGTRRDGHRFEISRRILPDLIAREKSLRRFRTWFGNGNSKRRLTERDKRALEYRLVKMGLKDPEERRKYITYRFIDDPEERQRFRDAYAEISKPYEDINAAADWLMLKNRSLPTVEELAKHLRTSKSALYQRLHRIMQVLRQRYHIDDLPDGVASQISGLPRGVRVVGAVDFDYDAIDD
jgi:hypothetical protein